MTEVHEIKKFYAANGYVTPEMTKQLILMATPIEGKSHPLANPEVAQDTHFKVSALVLSLPNPEFFTPALESLDAFTEAYRGKSKDALLAIRAQLDEALEGQRQLNEAGTVQVLEVCEVLGSYLK